ncbi:MAG: hypothetical protein KBD00_01200 [Candidatus Peribacteraceae bacterium]|nr:hypothetical protein [Candidatus Peribacteraceae bacterium]
MKPNFCPDREDQFPEDSPFTSLIGDLGQYERPFHPGNLRLADTSDDPRDGNNEIEEAHEVALQRLIALGLVVRER